MFLLDHQFIFLDLGLLWGKFLLVFWGALVGHTLVCSVPGGDHHFFFSCPSFCFSVLFFGSVEPQGVCWDVHVLVSLTMPQQTDTNMNRTVCVSCPVHTFHLSQCHSFDYPGLQFTREHLLQ